MNIPLLYRLALASLLGLAVLLRQPDLPDWRSLAFVGLLLALVGGWLSRRRPLGNGHRLQGGLATLITVLAIACLAASWGAWRSHQILQLALSPQEEGTVMALHLEIEDLPQRQDGERPAWRFQARDLVTGRSLMVSWPVSVEDPNRRLAPGQQWKLYAKVRHPAGTRNFYGFDLETWLFQKRVQVTAQVRETAILPAVLSGESRSLSAQIDRARDAIRQAIAAAVPEARHAGVLSGLVVGEQQAISASDWAIFATTGVSHLMSISGMHVTMFAVLARGLVGLLWGWLSRPPLKLALHVPTPVAAAVAASLAAFAYALLAGFNLPAQRTAWMVTVAALATVSGLQAKPWAILSLTLMAILVLDPLALLAPGFWLSFFAVAVLFGMPTAQQGWRGSTAAAVRAQLAITLGIAPLTIVFFQQLSVVGPLANALAIPIVTFVVTPLAMLGALLAFYGVSMPLVLGELVFGWLFDQLVWMSAWDGASLRWHAPAVWASLVAVLGAGLALQSSLPRWRHAGWIGLLALLWPTAAALPEGGMRAHFFDVGQGSAVLVQTQHHALLVDTGPPMGASTAAERVLVPQLAALGVRGLDGLVITHADIDHSSGLETVWSTMRPGFLLTTMTGRTEQPQARCEAGQSWVWDGVWFRVVFPFADDPPPPHQRGRNEDSCVLEVIDMRGNRLLLTGDIPAEQERALLERAPWVGQGPTVLLMPHHGSKTSSSDALLGRLRPVLSVAQSAYRGRFAHPAPEVIERHARHGIAVARTDLMGGLQVDWPEQAGAGGFRLREAASETRRFWHRPRGAEPGLRPQPLLGQPAPVDIPGRTTHLTGRWAAQE